MAIVSRLKRGWHRFWLSYNGLLLESCLDEKLQRRFMDKIHYHKMRIYS